MRSRYWLWFPLLAFGCGGASTREDELLERLRAIAPDAKPARAIVFVSLDTVRADHLSLYGYHKATSPNLEVLARDATVYTSARATAPWTLPSHASMFTGLYPFEHGARSYDLQDPHGEDYSNAAPLAAEATTLAEVLAESGYRTGAFVANTAFLDPALRLDQGFELYDCQRGLAPEVNGRAFSWVRGLSGEPFFLFLNYMDAHRPYNCVARPGFPPCGSPEEAARNVKTLRQVVMGAGQRPEQLIARTIQQYDTALANLDAGLGELFGFLKAQGVYEDALIIVTSDHGEYFGEHLLVEHSKDVYEEAVHVPLIVKPPGGLPGSRIDRELVSHVHIPGIVLAHVGPGVDAEGAGRLLGHWPRGPVLAENYYSRLHDLREPWGDRFDRIRRALFREDFKFVQSSDGQHELFDLSSDPSELENLIHAEAELAAELEAQLDSLDNWPDASGGPPREWIEEGALDRGAMSALGYAGDEEDE